MIYSTGYERITTGELEETMKRYNITLIIDVRSVPYSRRPDKYGFNRNQMARKFGNAYRWKGDVLGGKQGPVTQEAIQYLAALKENNILLCLEENPLACHRVTDISVRLLNDFNIEVYHLRQGRATPTSELLKEVLYNEYTTH